MHQPFPFSLLTYLIGMLAYQCKPIDNTITLHTSQTFNGKDISVPKLNFSEYVRHRTLTSTSTHPVTVGSRFYIKLSIVDSVKGLYCNELVDS